MKSFGIWGEVLIVAAIVLGLFCLSSRGATSSAKHNNVYGSVSYQDNPYTYKVGSIQQGSRVPGGLVLRLQPSATYMLFTEDILFCDYPVEMLQGKRSPLVLIYETRAHRAVEGIGCHKLVRVLQIQSEQVEK